MIDRAAIAPAPMIEPERCKGCGLCVAFCPFSRLRLSDQRLNQAGYRLVEIDPPTDGDGDHGSVSGGAMPREMRSNFGFWCTRCRYCELMCPEGAVRVPGSVHGLEGVREATGD